MGLMIHSVSAHFTIERSQKPEGTTFGGGGGVEILTRWWRGVELGLKLKKKERRERGLPDQINMLQKWPPIPQHITCIFHP